MKLQAPGFRMGGGDIDKGLDENIEVTSISSSISSKESQSPESRKELQLARCVCNRPDCRSAFLLGFCTLIKTSFN